MQNVEGLRYNASLQGLSLLAIGPHGVSPTVATLCAGFIGWAFGIPVETFELGNPADCTWPEFCMGLLLSMHCDEALAADDETLSLVMNAAVQRCAEHFSVAPAKILNDLSTYNTAKVH